MEKMLVYGDSNIWGDNFVANEKLSEEKRWINLITEEYKDKKQIFYDGLPGRVAGNIEVKKTYKNGKDVFLSTFRVHAPIDTLVISLGTNDLQIGYNRSSEEIYKDLMWYKEYLTEMFNDQEDKQKYFNYKFPKMIYILPANFDYKKDASVIFDEKAEEKRQELIKLFKDSDNQYIILDNIDLVDGDGIHYSELGHKQVADIVKESIYE